MNITIHYEAEHICCASCRHSLPDLDQYSPKKRSNKELAVIEIYREVLVPSNSMIFRDKVEVSFVAATRKCVALSLKWSSSTWSIKGSKIATNQEADHTAVVATVLRTNLIEVSNPFTNFRRSDG